MGRKDDIDSAKSAFATNGSKADSIMLSKVERYGTENISKQGVIGLLARMEDKLARARTLASGDASEADGESLIDTFLDMRNYATIAACVAEGSWPNTKPANDTHVFEPGECLQVMHENRPDSSNLGNISPPKINGDAGYDITSSDSLVLAVAVGIQTIKTGIRVKIPRGYWAEIRGRSSMTRAGIIVVSNTIDNGYTGELFVDVINTSDKPIKVAAGDRVAQLVLFPLHTPPIMQVDALPETDRGQNGFGSTGK